MRSWLDRLFTSKEKPAHPKRHETIKPIGAEKGESQLASGSSLKREVRRKLEVYRAALAYLNSLDRLDEHSFEKLDMMLEQIGAALGPEKRQQMLEASAYILPDPSSGHPGGMEAIKNTLNETLGKAIRIFGELLDGLPDESDARANETIVKVSEHRQLLPRARIQNQFVCRITLQSKSSDPEKPEQALVVVDSQGHLTSELIKGASKERLSTFAVSPDGHWVAYTCYVRRPEGYDPFPQIRAVSVDGHKTSVVTSWDTRFKPCYLNPVFSPLGDRLVCQFALEREWNPDLLILRLDEIADSLYGSSEAEIVNPLRIGNHAPQFLPDGKRIVYFGNFAYEDLLEICLYDPNQAKTHMMGYVGERLTDQGHGVWHRPRAIAVQPGWEQVFFIRGHTLPNERICVFTLSDIPPGAVLKGFTTIGGEYDRIGSLQISSDGQWLAFDADDSIYIIATDGSNLRRVSPEDMPSHSPSFSPDGTRVSFVRKGRICTTNLHGNELTQVTGDELVVEESVWV